MRLKKALLGTTALLGAGAMLATASTEASAVEVKIGGYFRSGAIFGDTDEAWGSNHVHSFYFRNESEVHVKASGKDDATGMEYGATMEFENDNAAGNTQVDEEWLYIKGGWGELRLGDNDGPVDDMKVTAASVAAGTGGIDGWGEVSLVPFYLTNSGDATKIIYFSPVVAGFQLGASFTPDSGHLAGGTFPSTNDNNQRQDWIEAAATYTASLGGADLKIGGGFGTASHESGATDNDFMGYGVGAQVGFAGIKVAGSYARNDFDNAADSNRWTVGAGASLGPADVSVTFVQQNNDGSNDPRNLVFSATVGLFPGMSLQGDVAVFDRDTGTNDDGVLGAARLHVAF